MCSVATIGSRASGLCACLAFALLVSGCTSERDEIAELTARQREGHFAETVGPLRALLERSPADPTLNRLYGEALLRTGEAGSAVWPLRRAAESPELAVDAGLLLTRALIQGSSYEDAIEAASGVMAVDPENREALVLRAQARVAAQQHEEALVDLDRAIELEPDNLRLQGQRLISLLRLKRIDEVEQGIADMRELAADADDPAQGAFLCATSAQLQRDKDDLAAAERRWEECLKEHPDDPTVLSGVLHFFADTGKGERREEILRALLERNPQRLDARSMLADALREQGEVAEAERLLLEATQLPSATPLEWQALAEHYVATLDFESARDTLESSFQRMGTVPDPLRFAYADVLIQTGDYEKAQAQIESVQLPTYRSLLRGRLRLARGDPHGALEALEEGIVRWPGNPGARYFAGQAAEQLGDFPKAIAHYREAVREDPAGSDAALALARLFAASGAHRDALVILATFIDKVPGEPEAFRLVARASQQVGNTKGVDEALVKLAQLPGQSAAALAERAALIERAAGSAKTLAFIESQRVDLGDPSNLELLRQLVDAAIAQVRPEKALAQTERALRTHPEQASFHALHGRALLAKGDLAEARDALARALALDAEEASALRDLAALAAREGDLIGAVSLYDRAAAADPADAVAPLEAIRILAADAAQSGDVENRLEALLRRQPHHPGAALQLAALSLGRGDLDGAATSAARAVYFRGGPDALDLLGRIQLERGESARAVETLRRALAEQPDRAATQYWLGRALLAQGDVAGGREALVAAVAGGGFPEIEEARTELARLEGGSATPAQTGAGSE